MLSIEYYLNIIKKSPIPCIWGEFNKNLDQESYDVKVLGVNNKLKKELANIKENHTYNVNKNKYEEIFKAIENKCEGIIIEYIEDLNTFYEISIQEITENIHIIWFIKKIKLDNNIKKVLNEMDIYLWRKDKMGRYMYISKGYDTYDQASLDNIVGKYDFEIFPNEVAKVFIEDDNELKNSGEKVKQSITFFNEKCYRGINTLIKNDENENIGTMGVCIDTLKTKSEEGNEISDAKVLELISDTIPDSIFFKDNEGVFRHCNRVFAEHRNLTKEEVIGKTEIEIGTSLDKIKKYEDEEKEIRETKRTIISINTNSAEDGRERYFETIKVPFLDDHKIVGGVLGISRDISHRKEADLEFERLRMEFFANLSHEFKTPLNLIFSSIQLIEFMIDRGECIESYKRYTKIVKQNGYRLLKLVNNLIDSTRLNVGCLEYNPQNYNIVEFIENICESVQYYANEQNIEVIFDTYEEEKIMAFDLEKMERIILNLLSNAIKYNKEKGTIEVTLSFDEKNLQIKVKDSGVGIPKDKLDDVFKLFKQINNRITKLSEGSGIGLSIVKSLIDLHDGKISVFSEPGEGSEFIINIPIYMCEEKEFEKNAIRYNKYVENIDIEFSDIYSSIK